MRSQTLHTLDERMKNQWLQQQVGQHAEVLWERGKQVSRQFVYTGYTSNYCKVLVKSNTDTQLENTITSVCLSLQSGDGGVLLGELI